MVTKINKIILVAGILLLSISSAISQKKANKFSKEPIPLDSSVKVGKLDNGFTYFLKKNENPPGQVVMSLVVKAGGYYEEKSQIEYAHLVEHVASQYSENYPDIFPLLRDRQIVANAFTEGVSVTYWFKIPESKSSLLNFGLDVMKDQAGSILLDKALIRKERGAVLGEMRRTDPYSSWQYKTLGNIAISNTGYPIEDKNENRENLKNFNLEAFKSFYEKWYRPDRQALIVVGDINIDSLERKIKTRFSKLKNPRESVNAEDLLNRFKVNLTGEIQSVRVIDTIDPAWKLHIMKKNINYEYHNESEYDLHKMLVQKLYKAIISERGKSLVQQYDPPFSNLSVKFISDGLARGQITVSKMELDLGDSKDAIRKKLREGLKANEILNSNFSQRELRMAKEDLKNDYTNLPFDSFKWVLSIKDYWDNNDAVVTPENLSKMISNITLDEVQDFAREAGDLSKNTDYVFMNVPEKFIPKKTTIKDLNRNVNKTKLPHYQNPLKQIDSLATTIPEISNVTEPKIFYEEVLGLTTLEFNGGIKVVLKNQKSNQKYFNNQMEIHGFKPLKFYKDHENSLRRMVAHNYPAFSGAGNYNHFQIEQFKTDRNLRMHFYTDAQDYIIEGEFDNSNLKDFFSLLLLYAKQPEENSKAFNYWKKNKIEQISDFHIRDSYFFNKDIEKIWNPKLTGINRDFLEEMESAELFQAYKDHFSNFQGYTFIITGDFSPKKVIPEITRYINALPIQNNYRSGQTASRKIILEDRQDTIIYKNLNQALVQMYLPVKVSNDMKTRVMLEIIDIALYEKIFEKLRVGCYSPGAGGDWMNFKNKIYAFSISFDSELGNEHNMLRYTNEVIEDLRKNGVDEEWLNLRVQSISEKFYERLKLMGIQNYWPGYLKNAINRNEPPEDFILQFGTIVENFIEVEELNELIKELFTKAKQQTYIALPKDYVDKIDSM